MLKKCADARRAARCPQTFDIRISLIIQKAYLADGTSGNVAVVKACSWIHARHRLQSAEHTRPIPTSRMSLERSYMRRKMEAQLHGALLTGI